MIDNDVNPIQFVEKLLRQHFEPWHFIEYENEIIDREIEHLKPTSQDLVIIKKYLSYHILKDFKIRMYARYEHSIPINSLEYCLKRLSIAVIESSFNYDKTMENYSYLVKDIKRKDPDFNLHTYIDNMIRIKFMPHHQQKVLKKVERIITATPTMNKFKSLKTPKRKY